MPFFDVGDVRVADDSDMKYFMSICDNHDGWSLEVNKPDLQIWCKPAPDSDFKIVKLKSNLKDVGAGVMYDVLHDPDYRKEMPPQKCFIRAISQLTGYLIRPLENNGCELTYVAQCDLRGKLPAWAVNKATQYVAPKVMTRLLKAALKYPAWKKKHNPDLKPWLYPEQLQLPRINFDHIIPTPDFQDNTLDESQVTETIGSFDAVSNEDLNGDSPLPLRKLANPVE